MSSFTGVLICNLTTLCLSLVVFILLLVAETIFDKIIIFIRKERKNEQNRK